MNKKLLLIVVANIIVLAALFFMVMNGQEKDDPLDTDYVMTIIDEKQLQKNQLDSATQELASAKEEIERLAEQLDITQLLVDSTEQKYLVCEQQKSEFTGEPPPPRVKPSLEQITLPEAANCDAELAQLAQAASKYKDLEAENAELNGRLSNLLKSVDDLQREREELIAKVNTMQDYDTLNSDNLAFQQEVTELRDQITQLKQEKSEAEMENSLAIKKNQDLLSQIEKLRNIEPQKFDTTALDLKIDELEREIALLNDQKVEASRDNESLSAENTKLQAQIKTLNAKEIPILDTSKYEQEIAKLTKNLESLQNTNREIQVENNQISEKYKSLDSENSKLTNENSELVKKNIELTNKNREQANENTELTNKNNELANENSELANENSELANKNTELTNNSSELLSQLRNLEASKLNSSNKESSQLTARVVQLQQQVDMLRQKNTEIQQENRSIKEQNKVLLVQMKELENTKPIVSKPAVDLSELNASKSEIVRLQTLLNSPIALEKHYLGARFCDKPNVDSLICVKDFLIRPSFTKSPVGSVAIRVFDEQGFVQAEGRFVPKSNQLYRLSLGAGKAVPAGNFKIEYYVDNQVLTGAPITLTQ